MGIQPLPNRDVCLRILKIAGYPVYEVFEGRGTPHTQIAAAISVAIDVSYRMLLKLFVMLFGPFRRTEQHGLLAIPGAIDDCPLWPPPLFDEFTQRPSLFE